MYAVTWHACNHTLKVYVLWLNILCNTYSFEHRDRLHSMPSSSHVARPPAGTLEEAVYKRQIYKQQQSNMVIDGTEEPRYWEGVQVGAFLPHSTAVNDSRVVQAPARSLRAACKG